MAELAWDEVGTRTFESGLDRGVIYLPNGSAVPWNGLTSVSVAQERSVESINYDGVKIHDIVSFGSFSATLSAITYPDEVELLEGNTQVTKGISIGEQPTVRFGLSYRTRKGNDVDGDEAGYKIHVVYNVSAIPSDKEYTTVSDDPGMMVFEWELSAVPEYFSNFRPSAHFTVDTTKIDPFLLIEIERILYGNTDADASLIPMSDLITFLNTWFRVYIKDNGDGTWTAETVYEGYIFPEVPYAGAFTLQDVDAEYIDASTYIITDSSLPLSGPGPDPDPDPDPNDIFDGSYESNY